MSKGRRRRDEEQRAVEARRALVEARLLERKAVREIVAELAALPVGERPEDCSRSTVHRDVVALRAEWAKLRTAAIDEMVAEELARLNAMEQVWWPKAKAGDGPALYRWLALQRQRMEVVQPKGWKANGVQLPGTPEGGAMRVTVEYVDDWRSARNVAAGVLETAAPAAGEATPTPVPGTDPRRWAPSPAGLDQSGAGDEALWSGDGFDRGIEPEVTSGGQEGE